MMCRLRIVLLLATCLALTASSLAAAAEADGSAGADHDGVPIARGMHTATLLPDGRALIAGGGTTGGIEVAEAEVWDPASERSEIVGSLAQTRWGSTASLLPDGRVLLAGGSTQQDPTGEMPATEGPFSLESTEIWDAEAGFTAGVPMAVARFGHTATTLPDGRVLVVGGTQEDSPVAAEIWDPGTGTFLPSGTPLVERNWGHTATLLPDGRVLFVGGQSAAGIGTYDMTLVELAVAEVWDPRTDEFTEAGALEIGRVFHTASPLPDGRVLVTGGFGTDADDQPTLIDSAVAWDPATNSFTEVATMTVGRIDHLASVLPDGKVFIAGGIGFEGGVPDPEADIGPSPVTLVELFDPVTESFAPVGRLTEGREYGTATALADGRVLLIGGSDHEGEQFADPEIWTLPDSQEVSD